MTKLELQLLAVVQEVERCHCRRESQLNERLDALMRELDGLSGQVEDLSKQVAALAQLLSAERPDYGNAGLTSD
jgi:predicted  nucleic acid-binding Zn-ribbon protein